MKEIVYTLIKPSVVLPAPLGPLTIYRCFCIIVNAAKIQQIFVKRTPWLFFLYIICNKICLSNQLNANETNKENLFVSLVFIAKDVQVHSSIR